ncbi:MAG: hypothetical protein IIW61_05415, partial [Bacteroidaceae bacterium]|nr:hypothetical protein [Bacteroidaceae bacterium]
LFYCFCVFACLNAQIDFQFSFCECGAPAFSDTIHILGMCFRVVLCVWFGDEGLFTENRYA